VITDVGLRGMNGRRLKDIARQHRPDLHILFIAACAQYAENRTDFLDANMQMIAKKLTGCQSKVDR
jgi:two-component SAPR family response regulator